MSVDKYKMPDTYEEAVKRKGEVLEKINAYNEAMLLEQELPCSEDEIESLQEEYQILNDHLQLTEAEKIEKLSEDEIEIEDDGTVKKKETIFDKIHWFIYPYALISTIFASGILSKGIGTNLMKAFLYHYFDKVYDKTQTIYMATDQVMNEFSFWLKCIFSYSLLPLIIVILSLVVFLIFRKKGTVNKKITMGILIIHSILAVVVIGIILGTFAVKNWNSVYQNFEDVYMNYIYNNYYAG